MNKQPFPGCQLVLAKYYHLKKKLNDYFFHGIDLNITNTETVVAYTDVYNLIDKNPEIKTKNEKTFQKYEETFFNIFKNDLTSFCCEVKAILESAKNEHSFDKLLQVYCGWIIKYFWFLRWVHKIFSCIQKDITTFSSTSLYYTGLTILKNQLVVPLHNEILRIVFINLDKFKMEQLQEYSDLQFLIRVIGMCGFVRFSSVKLQKNEHGFFEFASVNKTNNQIAENEYESAYFKNKFVVEYIKYLKEKYEAITEDIIQLSTPQYVAKTTQYLQKQQHAADFFYPTEYPKSIIIRSIEQIFITNRCRHLISNPKTGLSHMMENDDYEGLKNLYKLTKRTSQQKIFGQYYQEYIQKYICEQILHKITAEEQKSAKKQIVTHVIDSIYAYYLKIDNITEKVNKINKDGQDYVLLTSQGNGFQAGCNKNNTVCNFLVYYCDSMLKKQQSLIEMNLKQTITKLSKLFKFLYSLDQFLKIYQRMLGIRILYDTFKNKEAQMEIINLLKKQVGLGTMAKITTMIQDYKFSEQFNSKRINIFRKEINFNFQVTLITSGGWQIQDLKSSKKLVPPELEHAIEIFEKQYHEQFQGRQLTWVFNYGRAIVQVKLNDQSKALLMLNNYQLCILLCLQRRGFENRKIGEVLGEVNPEEEAGFMASIMMLVKKGVLKKQGNPLKIESKNESISFNFDLKLKNPKLGCFEVPRMAERMAPISNEISNERAFIIQANIIKIMKMRKVHKYQDLVPDVIKMCKTFKAEIPMIKNQIQNCIHRQFLERDAKQHNMLIYKP